MNKVFGRLLVVALGLFCLGLCFSAVALSEQEPVGGDLFYLGAICAESPSETATGSLRSALYWYYPSPPYYNGIGAIGLRLQFSGPVRCDSVVGAGPTVDTLHLLAVSIDNDARLVSFGLVMDDDTGPVYTSGTRRLADMFFTAYDTGVVSISPEYRPMVIVAYEAWGWNAWFVESLLSIEFPGDFNGDGQVGDMSDVVYLIHYIFADDGNEPFPLADANGDCIVNITDVVYLVSYIFSGGPAPGQL